MILQLDLLGIPEGTAILIIGVLALLLWAGIQFRNPTAVVMWGISILTLFVVVLYQISFQLFLIAVIITVLLIIVGVVGRMMT